MKGENSVMMNLQTYCIDCTEYSVKLTDIRSDTKKKHL
jgi:hypothetical protein